LFKFRDVREHLPIRHNQRPGALDLGARQQFLHLSIRILPMNLEQDHLLVAMLLPMPIEG